jgi:hypothetical protein
VPRPQIVEDGIRKEKIMLLIFLGKPEILKAKADKSTNPAQPLFALYTITL